ncbi:hypothetical protein HDF08_001029 [Edaphobacter lichenicola]|uniref:Uncharacterized protein n=1 Tax=Tunturiibacter lichenicola TaxID=2051959 RepID=A0A852VHF7_9BACT|nr:hypothetical protein [Edaphobacter lichenicola]
MVRSGVLCVLLMFLRGVLEKERFWRGILLVRTWWNAW